MPERSPGITCSSRLSQPSDDPSGLSMPVSRIAWPSKWLRVRYGMAIACSDDQLVALPELAQRRKTRRETERVVQLDELRFLERKRASQRAVRRIAVRHDRGEAVEAAAQQDEHEPAARLHLREMHDGKSERGDAAEAHVADEGSAVHGHLH